MYVFFFFAAGAVCNFYFFRKNRYLGIVCIDRGCKKGREIPSCTARKFTDTGKPRSLADHF